MEEARLPTGRRVSGFDGASRMKKSSAIASRRAAAASSNGAAADRLRHLNSVLELTRDAGKTLVMATHNPDIVSFANRVGRLHDGKLQVSAVD